MHISGRRMVLICAALLCGFQAGCGGSSSSTPVNLQSGNWSVAASSAVTLAGSFVIGGSLTQTGNTISGVVHIPASKCFNGNQDVAVTGSVTGQKITLSYAATPDQTINVDATAGSATTISGTYSVAGTGCAAGDHGTINGTLVPPVTGTWLGAYTSSVTPGTAINVTATLTQSPTADAHGFFSVTGTVTATGTPCFTSGTISASLISGGSVQFNAAGTEQPTPSVISISGIMNDPATATFVPGIYDVTGPNCSSADNGTGSIAKQ